MRIPVLRAIALVLLITAGLACPAPAAQTVAAPAFTLELFNGQTLRLADLKGTAVVLLFWTQW